MARLPTTSDIFNAIAEPQRRAILDLLAQGERPVNDIAEALGMRQPQASKHLAVLKEVGLVTMQEAGRQKIYHLNGSALRPLYEWVKPYERLWQERFDRLDSYLQQLQTKENNHE